MRIKTLLLSALLGVAGMITAIAQSNVYSVNVVGYVSVTLSNHTTYRLLSNPLISSNSTVGQLFPAVQDGSQIFLLVGALHTPTTVTYDLANFGGWDFPDTPINAGQGFFFKGGPGTEANPVTVTFVGEVAQGAASNQSFTGGGTPLHPTYSLVGSLVPQAGDMIGVLQLPNPGDASIDGAQVVQYVNGAPQTATYDFGNFGGWDNSFTFGVAEGFWFANPKAAAIPWNRNFTVQ